MSSSQPEIVVIPVLLHRTEIIYFYTHVSPPYFKGFWGSSPISQKEPYLKRPMQ